MKRQLTEDEKYMREAIRQAKKAWKIEEVPIGCVIVYEGKIIDHDPKKVAEKVGSLYDDENNNYFKENSLDQILSFLNEK